ncbi:hypothetical protein PCANC_28462 [Puccinia coronata f. sp. avenae]|uniref:Uncharacterized protein n=1 Tax=Puccinia coronata f. sp. avenae TaxID=200324 RepID=A0A2N5RUD6_9BASI|nr:hypothetical protein PCANC_28462 [Puccinia coronata f. sp. avenae]
MGRRQLLPQTFSTEEAANRMQPFRTARRNHAQHSLCSPQLSTPLGRHLNCRQAQGFARAIHYLITVVSWPGSSTGFRAQKQ